ncbi:MAG TPA: DUF1684 domain-containing protein [Marmoricola sp.]
MTAAQTSIQLADWRARIAALYAAVRAEPDPAVGHRLWRTGRDELFATHPQSPVADQPELRENGVRYWPYDADLRFTAEVLDTEPEQIEVYVGDDGMVTLARVGWIDLPVGSLDVWRLLGYAGGLFVPLRDGTSGDTSYGGGRYLLDTAKGSWLGGDDTQLVVDLNFAYHPSCRYDPRWTCPLAQPGNTVTVPVEAGERL